MDTNNTPWIAVVDDEVAIRRALLRLLRSAGLAAQGYAGGAELLAELRDGQPDRTHGAPYCVVLDLHMPGMSGMELQAALVQAAPRSKVIVMTGQHSPELQAQAQGGGALAYMLKPMNDQLLLDALASARAAWPQP
jgi:FixJ family two-component response regulator